MEEQDPANALHANLPSATAAPPLAFIHLGSTDSNRLQLLHHVHLSCAPDSPFAELFDLNGSSRNTVMLAENKS